MDEILAVMIVIGITCGAIGFVFGFRIAKEHNPIIYDGLKHAKEVRWETESWHMACYLACDKRMVDRADIVLVV